MLPLRSVSSHWPSPFITSGFLDTQKVSTMETTPAKAYSYQRPLCVPHFAPGPQQCLTEELSSLLFKVLRRRVDVHFLEILASWSHRSCSTTWFWISTMGRQRSILRLFFLLLGTQCPVPDTWSLARKLVPLGMGVRHTVNKGHKKSLLSLLPHPHGRGVGTMGTYESWG